MQDTGKDTWFLPLCPSLAKPTLVEASVGSHRRLVPAPRALRGPKVGSGCCCVGRLSVPGAGSPTHSLPLLTPPLPCLPFVSISVVSGALAPGGPAKQKGVQGVVSGVRCAGRGLHVNQALVWGRFVINLRFDHVSPV